MSEEFKYFIIVLGMFFSLFLFLVTRNNKKWTKYLLGFAIFATSLQFFDINLASAETYRGTVRGIQFAFVDFIVLALLLVVLLRKDIKNKFNTPGISFLILYFAISVISLILSNEQVNYLYGFFVLFQMMKGIIIFWVFYNLIQDNEDYKILLYSLVFIAFINAAYAIYQRYLLGMHRIPGLQGNPNLLAGYIGLLIAPLLLAYQDGIIVNKYEKTIYLFAFLAACGTIILTISRAGLAAMALSIGLTALFVIFHKTKTSKKSSFIILIIIGLLGLIVAGDTLMNRFQNPGTPEGPRAGIEVSKEIFKNNFIFGSGINNFNEVSRNAYGYVDTAPAHSLFYLTLSELGFLGMFTITLLFLYFLYTGYINLMTDKKELIGTVSIAIIIAVTAMLLHNSYDDHFRRTQIFYMTIIYFAYIAKGKYLIFSKK